MKDGVQVQAIGELKTYIVSSITAATASAFRGKLQFVHKQISYSYSSVLK